MKIINTTTTPDGKVHKRVSNSGRRYSHAVHGRLGDNRWVVYSWHSREDLAYCAMRGRYGPLVGQVAKVEVEVKETKEKKTVAYPDDIFELDGISFARKDEVQAIGWYRGLQVVVRKYKSSFGASAYSMTPSAVTGKLVYSHETYLHTKGHGKLERQVKQIKDLIDQEFAKKKMM